MKQKTIVIEIHSGIVHVMRQAKGTTLIVRDFDNQGTYNDHELTHRNGKTYHEDKFVEREGK